MLSFFRNFSLNILIAIVLIKKGVLRVLAKEMGNAQEGVNFPTKL